MLLFLLTFTKLVSDVTRGSSVVPQPGSEVVGHEDPITELL